jgi:hypothetical protein
LVELQPSKLDVAGSNPVARSMRGTGDSLEASWTTAHVAQSVERVLGKDEVISSILIVGSSSGGAAAVPEN